MLVALNGISCSLLNAATEALPDINFFYFCMCSPRNQILGESVGRVQLPVHIIPDMRLCKLSGPDLRRLFIYVCTFKLTLLTFIFFYFWKCRCENQSWGEVTLSSVYYACQWPVNCASRPLMYLSADKEVRPGISFFQLAQTMITRKHLILLRKALSNYTLYNTTRQNELCTNFREQACHQLQ